MLVLFNSLNRLNTKKSSISKIRTRTPMTIGEFRVVLTVGVMLI
tara:strand:+ start:138 stop:269 length:132 start_codon:yes stop_codon:yes gene_type:complete